jgi:hypothetical protein
MRVSGANVGSRAERALPEWMQMQYVVFVFAIISCGKLLWLHAACRHVRMFGEISDSRRHDADMLEVGSSRAVICHIFYDLNFISYFSNSNSSCSDAYCWYIREKDPSTRSLIF